MVSANDGGCRLQIQVMTIYPIGDYPIYYHRGFGAKYGGVVRHCFQCGSKEEVDGVEGILNAYHETFKSGLVMSGPTDFSEIIMTAGALATSRQVRKPGIFIRLMI